MMDKKVILYGAGRFGRMALAKYGRNRVAYFCDRYSSALEVENIPVIRPERMVELCKMFDGYEVVITPGNFEIRKEMAKILLENNIPYDVFERLDSRAGGNKILHICGDRDRLDCLYDEKDVRGFEQRIPLTFGLFQTVTRYFREDFAGKQIDCSVYIGDHSLDAYHNHSCSKSGYVFAYNSVAALDDHVVMIPDYRACYDIDQYSYVETPELCQKAAKRPWRDPRIVWKGNITSDDSRSWLEIMSHKHPDILFVDDPVNDKNRKLVPMTDFAKHKYLLDIRGYGWSDRLKILLQLGRPIFLVNRPFKEWYTDQLVAWEHYIPVLEDMSDLIEKYHYMEGHPNIYEDIVRNMGLFADKYLSPKAILKYVKDVVLKYGIV